MTMNRRGFSVALLTSAEPTTPMKARNAVHVHGPFADGLCWSEVIPSRLPDTTR